jgi:6-phosphogluconate dehydrogenase
VSNFTDTQKVLAEFRVGVAGPAEAAMAAEIVRLRSIAMRSRTAVHKKWQGHVKRLQSARGKNLPQDVIEFHQSCVTSYADLLDQINKTMKEMGYEVPQG